MKKLYYSRPYQPVKLPLKIMLEPHILRRLEQVANFQQRTRSNLATALIVDGLRYRLNRVFIPYEKPPYADADENETASENSVDGTNDALNNNAKMYDEKERDKQRQTEPVAKP